MGVWKHTKKGRKQFCDLTYITDRIVAMGKPTENQAWKGTKLPRNSARDIRIALRMSIIPNNNIRDECGRVLIVNLQEKEDTERNESGEYGNYEFKKYFRDQYVWYPLRLPPLYFS